MAERGVDPKEEKKSFGSAFVIGIALLVALSLWAYWDDNFSRRPWKGVQAQFYRLDYNKAQAAYVEEDKKIQQDAKKPEVSKNSRRCKAKSPAPASSFRRSIRKSKTSRASSKKPGTSTITRCSKSATPNPISRPSP